jgi:hypothetical protein
MSQTPSDRRGGTRKPAHFVAELELDGAPIGCAVSRDASTAGLLLLTQCSLGTGKQILVRLWITAGREPRHIEASVVRCERLPLGQSGIWTHKVAVSLRDQPSDFGELIDLLADS